MELLTSQIRNRLLANGALRRQMQDAGKDEPNFIPVVKLFTPDAGCTWLLTEIDPTTRTSPSAFATSAWAFRNSGQ